MSTAARRTLVAALVLAALVAAVALLALPRLPGALERALVGRLEALGLENVTLSVPELGWRGLAVSDLRAGREGGLRIERVVVSYEPTDLLRLRVGDVRVIRPSLVGVLADDGLTFPAIASLLVDSGDGAADFVALPLETLALVGGRVELRTPNGSTTAHLDAEARATGDAAAVAFSARARDPRDRVRLEVTGTRAASGAVDAQVELAPVTFGPEVLQPEELFPGARAWVEGVTGRIEASGPVHWTRETNRADLAVRVEDLSLVVAGFAVEGMNADLRIVQLAPLATAPEQRLEVARVRSEMDLGRGSARFALTRDGLLQLDDVDWEMFGGRVRTGGTFDLASPRQALSLHAERLDVAKVVAAFDVADLSATGTLSGEVPLVFEDGSVTVDAGGLASTLRGGSIHYRSAVAPPAVDSASQGMGLVLAALEDFRYESLRLTLDGDLTGDVKVGVHLHGANPKVYEGHPLQFNLMLDVPLGSIVRGAQASVSLPQEIERRVLERMRRNE